MRNWQRRHAEESRLGGAIAWPWLVCAVALLTTAWSHRAAGEGAESGLPAGRGVVVVWPGILPKLTDLARLRRPGQLEVASTASVRISATDARFLGPLRRALVRGQGAEAGSAGAPACTPDAPRLADLVAQAELELDLIRIDKSGRLLSRAWAVFTCEPAPVSTELLAHLLFLHGVRSIYLEQHDGGYFGEALSLWPRMPAPVDYGADVRLAFDRAVERLPTVPRVPVRVDAKALEGLELWIDGRRATTGIQPMTAGRHFLQLVLPGGGAIAGAVVPVLSTGAEPVDLLASTFRPPTDGEIRERLQLTVMNGRADPALAAALETLRSAGDHPWLLIVVPGAELREAGSLWVLPAGEVAVRRLLCTVPPFCESRSTATTFLAAGLGTAAIVVAGGYGVSYVKAGLTTYASASDAETAVTVQKVGRVATIAGAVGTMAAISWNWRVPVPLYATRDRAVDGMALRLQAVAHPALFGLEVTW